MNMHNAYICNLNLKWKSMLNIVKLKPIRKNGQPACFCIKQT